VSLDAIPVGGHGCCAPATFRLTSKTKNAELLVWDCGDEAPLQIVSDMAGDSDQDRFVTFTKPGGYVIKLAAINGKQFQVKDTIINVDLPPPG
ncbi:hypothetical protein ABI060_14260, partial [Enterococcus faecium]|uniref:hypothetical protein n=1 Tax=Enterococcus faecium TaxID=1352 RepID=UPI003F4228AC